MTPEHERAQSMLSQAHRWRESALIDADEEKVVALRFEQPWRTHGVLVQAVFFVLTCVAQLAMYGLLHAFDVPKPGLASGAIALVVAEVLIQRKRWFGTGVEGALWLGGLFALISELPRTGTPESMLVAAAAAAVAAFRVRNPFFGLLAAVLVVVYGEERFDIGAVTAMAIGVAAMFALSRTWRRPSAELFFSGLSVLMPVVGRVAADAQWRTTTIVLYGAWSALALGLALARRHHALFLTAAIAVGVFAFDLAGKVPLLAEAKLALGGLLALGFSWIVSRLLRGRASGLVAREETLTGFDAVLEVAGALAAAQVARPDAPPDGGRPQGGGSFGGAGATGDF